MTANLGMNTTSDSIELIRARYRPPRVMVLFVGESAPASGKFFYGDENSFAGHIRRAIWPDIVDHHDFLDRFRSCGWFLDDLVLEPVDNEKLVARAAGASRLGEPDTRISASGDRVTADAYREGCQAGCGRSGMRRGLLRRAFSRPRKSEAVPRADGGHRSEAPVRGPGESFSDVILRLVEIEGKRHVQSE